MRRSGRGGGLSWWAFLALTQIGVSYARADPHRVALVDPGYELEHAARAALEPWQIELVIVPAPSPGASAPSTHDVARQIALASDSAVVVWVSEHETGYALWIYDSAAENVVARPLSTPPPFDGPTAAAVALSLKTLLRHSASAPEPERYGAASVTVPAAEPEDLRPERLPTQQTPVAVEEAVGVGSRPATQPVPFDFDAVAGLRFNLLRAGSRETRVGIGFSWWPRGGWAGVSLRTSFGPGVSVTGVRFRGVLTDVDSTLAARLRGDPLRWLRLSCAAGVSAHFSMLDGVARDDVQATVDTLRVVPALALELGADWVITPWLRLGVRGAVSWLLRTQRYTVRGMPVLELSRIPLEAAVVLGFAYYNAK